MTHQIPKRIAVIGLPGSGKSTFSTKLAKVLHVPVHHLDTHMFLPDGKKREKQEFITIQKALIDEDAWIIEGCSMSTLEMRFAQADIVIYFHFPRLLCLWRICKRLATKTHIGGPLEGINWAIVKYTWDFDRTKKAMFEELRSKYPHVHFLVFRRSREARQYLEEVIR